VADAVKRTIAKHADRAFALGYRISVEESIEGGLQIADSLQLVSRLIQKPANGGPQATVVSILRDHIGGRVPLLAAGRIKTPAQAESALQMGVSLVALGQGLVVDPDWMAHARACRDSEIRHVISAADVSRAGVPGKLWAVIEATPGWFDVLANESVSGGPQRAA
jgi:2,4-dienoyl-CoA reductase-like NADH-dependent reductase (Old Yellow Enzyme family)